MRVCDILFFSYEHLLNVGYIEKLIFNRLYERLMEYIGSKNALCEMLSDFNVFNDNLILGGVFFASNDIEFRY